MINGRHAPCDPLLLLRRGVASGFVQPRTTAQAVLDQARVTPDQAKRAEMYARVQRLIAEQVPFLFIAYADLFAVTRTQVQGFVLSSTRTMTRLWESRPFPPGSGSAR